MCHWRIATSRILNFLKQIYSKIPLSVNLFSGKFVLTVYFSVQSIAIFTSTFDIDLLYATNVSSPWTRGRQQTQCYIFYYLQCSVSTVLLLQFCITARIKIAFRKSPFRLSAQSIYRHTLFPNRAGQTEWLQWVRTPKGTEDNYKYCKMHILPQRHMY
jgi:hypothetical protein